MRKCFIRFLVGLALALGGCATLKEPPPIPDVFSMEPAPTGISKPPDLLAECPRRIAPEDHLALTPPLTSWTRRCCVSPYAADGLGRTGAADQRHALADPDRSPLGDAVKAALDYLRLSAYWLR